MRIAIIPARGGSKRIPKKNIYPFCGKPMIYYALNAAKESGIFDKIHVSTESVEIADAAVSLGYEVDFLRDASLADDYTGLVPVLNWVVEKYKGMGQCYTSICCIMPTAPLLFSNDIVQAERLFATHGGKRPLLVVTKYPVPIEWAFRKNDQGILSAVDPASLIMRSQDLEDAYYECGPFTMWGLEHLKQSNPLSGEVLAYAIPRERAVDIDTLEDLQFAEKLYKVFECQ